MWNFSEHRQSLWLGYTLPGTYVVEIVSDQVVYALEDSPKVVEGMSYSAIELYSDCNYC